MRRKRAKYLLSNLLLSNLLLAVFSASVGAAEVDPGDGQAKPDATTFVRIQRDDKNRPVTLETGIVSYIPADGTREGLAVDLIAAIHVGDQKYFEQLNELFKSYEVLLYELVAPEGVRPHPDQQRQPAIGLGTVQGGMSEMLELAFQLDEIDYTAANFVHADMTPAEFARSMENNGETMLSLVFQMIGHSIAAQSKNPQHGTDLNFLAALFSPNRALMLKRTMAEQMHDMDTIATLGGQNSTLVVQRNKKALDVLRREIGADHKKLGIFYGAAHLPDMEQRLVTEFQLKRDSQRWLPAWDMSTK